MPLRPLVGGSRDGKIADLEDAPEITFPDGEVYAMRVVYAGDPPYSLVFYTAAGRSPEYCVGMLLDRMYTMLVVHTGDDNEIEQI
jgi:hypothetical protein